MLSNSAAELFPDAVTAGGDDSWYDLPDQVRWDTAMAALRRDRPWARLSPGTLQTVTFGPGVTVYDLFASDRDERVRAAFEGPSMVLDPPVG